MPRTISYVHVVATLLFQLLAVGSSFVKGIATAGAKVDSLRPTPFGAWVPQSCVTEVPSGTLIDARGGYRTAKKAIFPDGTTQLLPFDPSCPGANSKGNLTKADKGEVGVDSYKQWRVAAQFTGSSPARKFNGIWTVPENPQNDVGQILYTFTGIQPPEGVTPVVIAQPVLEYHEGSWTLASWWCCNHGHSTPIPTAPGHVINGTMELRNGVWIIETKDMNTGQSTVLKVAATETLQTYYVTLETYGIQSCNDYPNGDIPYSQLVLENNQGAVVTPNWGSDKIDPDCNDGIKVHSPSAVSIVFGNSD